jgi:BASS family bile acid:Na+ symporter
MIINITRFFPLWAVLFSVLAFFFPQLFINLKICIIPLLCIIMFGMGMTLTFADFSRIFKNPGILVLGVSLQYCIMPFAAYIISLLFKLPLQLFIGMVLVGSSSGGTASNVICYLAKGNVALSITLTMLSTFLAVIIMPFLTWLYVSQSVYVPFMQMVLNILFIVIVPVSAGIIINTYLGDYFKNIKNYFPLLSVSAIVLIIAIIVAINYEKIMELTPILLLAVIAHNIIGLFSGYWVIKGLGYDRDTARTVAIEVGMQNSGLSVALAVKHFSGLAALPGALFSLWHNISGSFLAAYWSLKKK